MQKTDRNYICCSTSEFEFFVAAVAVHNVDINIRIILKVRYRAVRIEKVGTGFIIESFPTAQQVMPDSNSPHPQMSHFRMLAICSFS